MKLSLSLISLLVWPIMYWVFRTQADWTFILSLELPAKELRTCREKSLCAAPRTEMSDKPATAFFSASGAALS
jgi:hypothetical protein